MILILFKPEMTPCRPKRWSSSTIVPFKNHLYRINIATTCYLPQSSPCRPLVSHPCSTARLVLEASGRTSTGLRKQCWEMVELTVFTKGSQQVGGQHRPAPGSKMPRWRAVLPNSDNADLFPRHTAGSVLDLFMFWGPGCWWIGIANLQWLALIKSFIPTSRIIKNAQLWDGPRNENPGITNM